MAIKEIKYQGSFMNPVGSVSGSSTYHIEGEYGRLRHRAQLSPDNPYLAQLAVASDNQDMDSIYAQAIEWEADRVNDQNEYQQSLDAIGDKIQAEREAGINPDLVGSSGSGTGSSVNNSTIADQQSGIPTSNSYAESSLILQGISSATSFVSSLSQLGLTLGNLYQMSELLPSQKKQANAQARLSEVSADVAEQTKSEVVSGVSLANITSRVQMARDLADMFGDSSVEDITANLGSFGFNPDQSSGIAKFIDQYRQSPHYKKKTQQDIKDFNDSFAYNAANTVDELIGIYEDVQILRRGEIQLQKGTNSLRQSTTDYLNSIGFGRVQGQNIMESTQANIEGQKLAKNRFIHDLSSLCKMIEDSAINVKWVNTAIADLKKKATKEGRRLTAEEQNIINSLVNKRDKISSLGSLQINQLYSVVDEVNAIYYYGEQMTSDNDGQPFNSATFAPRSIFMDITFGKVLSSNLNASQLMSIFSTAINGVGDLGQAYLYGKGALKPQPTTPTYQIGGYSYTTLQ